MVMTTSASATRSYVSWEGVCPSTLMPRSASTRATVGLTPSPGSLPALLTTTRSPP
jgi:hypothetical protein